MADENTPLDPPPPNMPADESESVLPSASARFRSVAQGAINNAKTSHSNSSLAAAVTAAAARAKAASAAEAGSAANGPVDITATPPPTGTPPPPPTSTDAPPLSQMKSKAIYDIARTKIMANRALYRLSSETGFIKLRSRPPPKIPGSGSTIASGTVGATNGAKEAPPVNGQQPAKAVSGWKEQGAIDSGKKAAPAP
ncbi:hypothetical protein GGI08_007811, partial [Coemansia sp. S2]